MEPQGRKTEKSETTPACRNACLPASQAASQLGGRGEPTRQALRRAGTATRLAYAVSKRVKPRSFMIYTNIKCFLDYLSHIREART